MFMGQCFSSTPTSLASTLPISSNLETLTIERAIFDDVYASNRIVDIADFTGQIPSEWDWYTRLHAAFNENLYGGNVSFTESIVESIRIKKRTKKDNKFRTIYEKPILTNEDFDITITDYYEPVGNIEYACVPVISGGENEYITTSVQSKFNSYFFCERGISYPLILDTIFSKQLNQRVNVIETLGRQYPLVIKNGNLKYYSGDIECTFIEEKDHNWLTDDSWNYRNIIYDFLTNGNPKILKDFEGNIWMVAITSGISETSDHWQHYISKFSIAECGNAYDVGDLYDNGLIDTDIDR